MGRIGSSVAGWVPRVVAATLTACLMVAAFPPFDHAESAWFALVPLLLYARFHSAAECFRTGYLAGFVFWLINVGWLLALGRNGGIPWIVATGWVILAAYSALYVGGFAFLAGALARRTGRTAWFAGVAWVLLLALGWTGLEYIRATVLSGFPWNPLGVSQWRNRILIQCASLGGVYLVSALVVAVNGAAALLLERWALRLRGRPAPALSLEMPVVLALLAAAFAYGHDRLARPVPVAESIRVAVVQPDIPSVLQWPDEFGREVYRLLQTQTEWAAAARPHLTVWPETALPDALVASWDSQLFVREMTALAGPILVGTMHVETNAAGGYRYLNASILVDGGGRPRGTYAKQHLVPFGEYIPLDKWIPWLQQFVPTGASCSPGTGPGIFALPDPSLRFASLICFEDTMPWLARKAVRAGARLLINQTNDAWFDGTSAPDQHMTHSVLRAVENGVPVVRAANNGVSCFIDPTGRTALLRQDDRTSGFAGFKVEGVGVPPAVMAPTPYTRWGDALFAGPCVLLTLALFVLVRVRRRDQTAPLANAAEPERTLHGGPDS